MVVGSIKHPLVQEARATKTVKGRHQTGKFLVEGLEALRWALEGRCVKLEAILYNPSGHRAADLAPFMNQGIPCHESTPGVLKKIAESSHLYHYVGIGARLSPEEAGPHLNSRSLALVMDHVLDHGNIGSNLRSALAFGVSEVVTIGEHDCFYRKAISASRGAVFQLPVRSFSEHDMALAYIKQHYHLVATSPRADHALHDLAFDGPLAIVVGNESEGVDPDLMAKADALVKIPHEPHSESLNVCVATGILLNDAYQALSLGTLAKL